MATVSVIEQVQSQSAEGDFERLGLVREFEVMIDDVNEPYTSITTAEDPKSNLIIPQKGEAHPEFPYATVQNIQAVRTSLYLWRVACIYGGGAASYEAAKYLADVEWDPVESQEDIDYDVYSNAIANAADERYEGISRLFYDQCLRITRSQVSYDPIIASDYMGTLNAATFLNWPAGSALMGPIRARRVFELSAYTWRVTYIIYFRKFITAWKDANNIQRGPWDARILNEGYRAKNGTNTDGTQKYIELKENGKTDGEKISKPALLNAAGTAQLAAGASPVFRYFTKYETVNWTPLALEASYY